VANGVQIRDLPSCEPSLPLHHTLICVHSSLHSPHIITTPSVNCFFKTLNVFKLKICQLQSFVTFWDLQLSFWEYSRSFTNLNFKFERFKHSFSLTIWFQIKKLWTTKFHNFVGSTTCILNVSPIEVVRKIQIFKFQKCIRAFPWQK
jgi:hypothetical protein